MRTLLDGEVCAVLLRLLPGEHVTRFGVPVARSRAGNTWSIAGGLELLLLAAVDALMRTARYHPVPGLNASPSKTALDTVGLLDAALQRAQDGSAALFCSGLQALAPHSRMPRFPSMPAGGTHRREDEVWRT
jgi:hypothetical protein